MTTALTAYWTVLVPLAQHTPPASKVKAGWVGFAVVVALILACVFLAFSFSKQLKKVRFDEDPDRSAKDSAAAGRDEDGPADREDDRPGPTPS